VVPGNKGSKMDEQLEAIAYFYLDISSLKPQGSDELDFHDLSVVSIKAALEAAYAAGKDSK